MKEIKLPIDKIRNHEQKGNTRCIPSAIEAVLKLLGKIGQDEYPLQEDFFRKLEEKREKNGKRNTLDFKDFSAIHFGVRFNQEFDPDKRGFAFSIA